MDDELTGSNTVGVFEREMLELVDYAAAERGIYFVLLLHRLCISVLNQI